MTFNQWQEPQEDNIPMDFTLRGNEAATMKAVEQLLQLPEFQSQNRTKSVSNLSVIVGNLVLAYKRGDEYRVSYHRGKTFYSKDGFRRNRFLNPKGISRSIIKCVDVLIDNGYIEQIKGSFNRQDISRNVISRMWATDKFVDEILIPNNLHINEMESTLRFSPVQVRDGEGKRVLAFDNSDEVQTYKSRLQAYNECYDRCSIEFMDERYNNLLTLENKHLHRVFNHGCLTKGGRFYGAWWQQKSEADRRLIVINQQDTIELDYCGSHIGLIHGLCGTPIAPELSQDPYNVSAQVPRELMKLCVLRALYNPTLRKARTSVNNELRLSGKQAIPEDDFRSILGQFCAAHGAIENQFFLEGMALTLQHLDSKVTDRVLWEMIVERGKPVLPIHDSFVVAKEDKPDLIEAMVNAYHASDDARIRNSFTSIKDKQENKYYPDHSLGLLSV